MPALRSHRRLTAVLGLVIAWWFTGFEPWNLSGTEVRSALVGPFGTRAQCEVAMARLERAGGAVQIPCFYL